MYYRRKLADITGMKKFGILLVLAQVGFILAENAVSYKNYRVYEVAEYGIDTPRLRVPGGEKNVEVLREYKKFYDGDSYVVRSYLVPESEEEAFRRVLKIVKADYNVSVYDLEESIQEERRSNYQSTRRFQTGHSLQKDRFYSYEEMTSYLKYLESVKNPDNGRSLVELERIGETYEGRDMYLVKISSDHAAEKPIIFFEAGIHAREWTAPAAALYTMHQLTENYTYTYEYLNNIDFYIIPLSNPDGYEYSRGKDRLWRKTRSVQGTHYGVDGNRNFGFHWGERGTSNDPASEIYKGPRAFSEVETRNIRDVGRRYANRIKAFVSIHAYGPHIVYPWSYARTKPAPHTAEMKKVATAAAEAIKKFSGTQYMVGVSSVLMYEAAGGSDDYFKGVLGVDLSFTIELSSAGEISFIVPKSKILEICSEAFEGFKVISKYASQYKKNQSKGEC